MIECIDGLCFMLFTALNLNLAAQRLQIGSQYLLKSSKTASKLYCWDRDNWRFLQTSSPSGPTHIKNRFVLTLPLVMCAIGPSKMYMQLLLNFLKSSSIFSLFFHLAGVGALMFWRLNWLYSSGAGWHNWLTGVLVLYVTGSIQMCTLVGYRLKILCHTWVWYHWVSDNSN